MVSLVIMEGTEIALEALRRGAVDVVRKLKARSLRIEIMGMQFKEKMRSIANAKLRLTLRLRERALATPNR